MVENQLDVAGGANAGEMAAEAPSRPLPEPVLFAMRLLGKTAGLATKAADNTAEGIVSAGRKGLSLPLCVCSLGARARSKRSKTKELRRVRAEIERQKDVLDDLYGKVGRRVCELDLAELEQDAQLVAFRSAQQDTTEVIGTLEEDAERLADEIAGAVSAPPVEADEPATAPWVEADEPAAVEAESVVEPAAGADIPFGADEPAEAEAAKTHVDAETDLLDSLVAVVGKHAEGIGLVDLGRQLDVSWQTLIPVTRELVESGRLRKDDQKYYPAVERRAEDE